MLRGLSAKRFVQQPQNAKLFPTEVGMLHRWKQRQGGPSPAAGCYAIFCQKVQAVEVRTHTPGLAFGHIPSVSVWFDLVG